MAHFRDRYTLDHLEQRGHRWYARINIPEDVRAKLIHPKTGRPMRKFRVALGTMDRAEAKREAAPLVLEWQRRIDEVRRSTSPGPFSWPGALRRASSTEERREIENHIVEEALEKHGFLALSQYEEEATPEDRRAVQRYVGLATGEIVPTSEHLERWITSLQVKPKTLSMRRQTVQRLVARFPMLTDITRRAVVDWISELKQDMSTATVQRLISDCRVYWAFLSTIEVAPQGPSPFERLGFKKPKHRSWLAYEPQQAVTLAKAAKGQLADLILLAMYTGARRSELCGLRIENINRDRFDINDAKTEAGIRTVPIHAKLRPVIRGLIGDRRDGFLFKGTKLTQNGYGANLGTEFGRLKTRLGFGDRHSFHSWRSTVITMLERAGVPESTVQDIVGHERSTLTGSTYSGKSTFEMRRAALAKLRYPTIS